MNKKIYENFKVKEVGNEDERVLRFVGTTESKDRDNDTIKSDGWETHNYMKNPVFLAVHDYGTLPVGKTVSLLKSDKSLIFDVKFPKISELSSDEKNPSEHAKFADTVYHMYKNKYLNAVSVGFKAIEGEYNDENKGIDFSKQELLELSAVPVPSNPEALQQVKGLDIKIFKKEIEKDEYFDTFIEKKEIVKQDNKETKLTKNDLEKYQIDIIEKFKKDIEETNCLIKALKEEVSFLYKSNKEILEKQNDEEEKNEINLDEIVVDEIEKNDALDELEIEQDEIKQLIKGVLKEELNKIKGGN
jgi:HK97 family phage prohead protease